MGLIRPLEPQPYGWEASHPRYVKRRRLSTHSWKSTSESNSHVECHARPGSLSPSRLELLPAEILTIILDFCLEASLIHTSRRLWWTLPNYVHYTKQLALKALVQIEDWPESPLPTSDHGNEIASMQQTLDPSQQQRIRRQVFASGWFRERHLTLTHRNLLYWTISQCCSWYGDNAPSKYQRSRIKSFVERQSAPSSSAVLYLRVPSGGRRIRYLSAKQLCVTISGAPFFRPLCFNVLDFGNRVPDDLLKTPLTTSKIVVIRDMCKSIWIPRDENSLYCDRKLLHQALLEAITFGDLEKFHVLLSLEERSRGPKLAGIMVLDLNLVRGAVLHGRSSMLIRLLKQIWTSPKTNSITDTELVRIIDDARDRQYPGFENTTRVLAMEVAAKWKMTEIEKSGRRAHRVPMDWPPRLIYPTWGSTDSQIWFIPRDSSYDIDWESSKDLPFLPFEYC